MRKAWSFIKDVYGAWSRHRAAYWSNVVAYNTIFSLAPVFVIAISVAGMVVGDNVARAELIVSIQSMMGTRVASAVAALLAGFQNQGKNAVAAGVGILVLLWGASNVFISLRGALNDILETPQAAAPGWKGFMKDRLVSFALVLAIGFVLLVSLVLSAVMIGLRKGLTARFPIPEGVLPVLDITLSFVVTSLLFFLIFKLLPSTPPRWRDALAGAVVTTTLFVLGKSLLGYFLGGKGLSSAYGAAGSLVLVILWVNYSAQILFVGAAITRVRARRRISYHPREFSVQRGGRDAVFGDRRRGHDRRQRGALAGVPGP